MDVPRILWTGRHFILCIIPAGSWWRTSEQRSQISAPDNEFVRVGETTEDRPHLVPVSAAGIRAIGNIALPGAEGTVRYGKDLITARRFRHEADQRVIAEDRIELYQRADDFVERIYNQ